MTFPLRWVAGALLLASTPAALQAQAPGSTAFDHPLQSSLFADTTRPPPFTRRVGGDQLPLGTAGPLAASVLDAPADTQAQAPRPGEPGRPDQAGYWMPIVQSLGLNVFVWSINHFVKKAEWADVGLETWKKNLREGWQFDDNAFQANQIAHPYHGGLFFSAARATGYDFWESAPVAFIGSWTWEYFAETYQPSFNDWINTSVGGIALGEITWRFSEGLLDDRTKGSGRFWREFGATAVNPMRGFNRLIRGEMWEVNPEYKPIRAGVVARATAGLRSIGDPSDYGAAAIQPMLRIVLNYGDDLVPFDGRPFDAFSMRMQLNGQDKHVLGLIEATGRLWANRRPARGTSIRQVFLYENYNAYELGAQSVMLDQDWVLGGETPRWKLSAGLIATILGAVKAENVLLPPLDEGYRDYDYGPGAGFRLGMSHAAARGFRVDAHWFLNYIHAINGSSGEHIVQRVEGNAAYPVWRALTANAGATLFMRRSAYTLGVDQTIRADNLEIRLGVGTEF